MQKLFLFSAITALLAFSIITQASQPGRYVRKQLKPNFFIPEKDLDNTEKLPEFNYYPKLPTKEKSNTEHLENTEDIITVIKAPQETDLSEKTQTDISPSSKEEKVTVAVAPQYMAYDKEELAKIPEYKQKYDDYINDLKEIAKTGKIPENPRVAFDLMKMSTNERLVVTEKFGLRPNE